MKGAEQHPNKQTNKQRNKHNRVRDTENWEIQAEKQKDILTNRHASRLAVDIRTQRVKHKINK